MKINTSTPVVLFRAENYTSLGIVRSLGRMGVKVYCIDHDENALAIKSRYCAGHFLWDTDSSAEKDTVQFLIDVGNQLSHKAMLLPTSDTRALLVDKYRAQLSEQFILPQPKAGAMFELYSKHSLHKLCKAEGIPTAESFFPESYEDALALGKKLGFPLVIKAIEADRLMHRTGLRMAIVQDQTEFSAAYKELNEPGFSNLELQEYIPWEVKDAWIVSCYFDTKGVCRFAITAHKLRQLPITGGVTTFGECVPCKPIVDAVCHVAKAAGYKGIIDADFLYDKRDGFWKLLDINPRQGANFRLLVDVNGIDVVRAMYLDLSGQPVPKIKPDWGRRWLVEDKDIEAMRDYRREGLLTIRDWLRSLKSVSEFGYMALDDLSPSVMYLKKLVKYYLRGLFRRLPQWLTQFLLFGIVPLQCL